MKHLFGNIIAAVDVETTGTRAGHHEIVQIAMVPLDKTLRPFGQPFYTNICPEHPERADPVAFEKNGLDIEELMEAPNQDRVIDLFDEWFQSLGLPVGKKLVPLAHNCNFERDFLRAWLGLQGMETYFHYHWRDAMILALAIKDQYGFRGQEVPFGSMSLDNLCKVYGIVNTKAHDALADSIAEAELYRTLLGVK